MNKQLTTVLATLSLLVSTGGCSGMRNFLFGRGAACGTCAAVNPGYGVAPPSEPACGYEPACGQELAAPGPFARLRGGCCLSNGQPNHAGQDCECGSSGAYMPSNVDAYGSQVHDPYAYNGEVIGSEVIGNGYNGYPVQGQIVGDNFDARGDRIISQGPVGQAPINGPIGGSVVRP